MRFNFMDPLKGVHTAADEVALKPPCGGLRSARLIRAYYRDWRNHDCQGFTADLRCRKRKFTLLQDAHPDFEYDVLRYLQSKLLCEKSKLSVEIFAAELNSHHTCACPATVSVAKLSMYAASICAHLKYGGMEVHGSAWVQIWSIKKRFSHPILLNN